MRALVRAHHDSTALRVQDPQALGPLLLLSQVLLQEGRDWSATEKVLRGVLALDSQHGETRHDLDALLRHFGRAAVAV